MTYTKLLVVDDDVIDRKTIIRTLSKEQNNYDIVEADSADDAYIYLDQMHFDVILMDYNMPQINGVEAIVKLRSQPQLKHTAIVMISNLYNESLVLDCINAGAQDFLLKQEVTSTQLTRSILQARKRHELEQQLYDSYRQVKQLAEKDPLTGLHNRFHFDEMLNRLLLARQRRKREIVAVMMLDLDKFKHINDNFGHEVGDQLLIAVADRIKEVLRENELLARLGGDEFAFACGELTSIRQIKAIAQRVLDTFYVPFDIDGHAVHCSGSIGIAIAPINSENRKELMKLADIAMYRAKNGISDKICIFQDNMQEAFLLKYQIESELKMATQSQHFELSYHPVIESQSDTITIIEALIRWPMANTTQLPEEFIPIAEEAGLIQTIGQWVLEHALYQFKEMLSNDHYQFRLSVNVSQCQLCDNDFANTVQRALETAAVAPDVLVLEITEAALLQNDQSINDTLLALSEMGVGLALDDFGTGLSSISHLLQYPFDIVKIDSSIVQNIAQRDSKHHDMLQGLSYMLEKLNITVVGEGVETTMQAQACNDMGITQQQGFLFYQPMSVDKVKNILKDESKASRLTLVHDGSNNNNKDT
ncbi:EAL domain-containing protein [Pseudoalteromonas sp. SMS1]|uniref:two-component system response regulator n=1 Tax=Pseudoalteromonas sp. SMS1 TaxID=2908894 RepID=UPI001F4573AC|nr:GGDEF domain-containing response regulator [Pseudoalteromonas sp. SMS1]MCF2857106.1 EAL domain-containing protein [Pseudoalteromonas sp. SMS1]